MPYADPEAQRAYDRRYKRDVRSGRRGKGAGPTPERPSSPPPASPRLPVEYRLRKAEDVLAFLERHAHAVDADEHASPLEKARVAATLASSMLKAIEAADVAARVEAIENALNARKQNGR